MNQGAFQAPQGAGFAPMMFDPTRYQSPINPPNAFPSQDEQSQGFPGGFQAPQQPQQPQPPVVNNSETLGNNPDVNNHYEDQQQQQQQNYDYYNNYNQNGAQEASSYNYWDGYNYNYQMDQNQGYNYQQQDYQNYQQPQGFQQPFPEVAGSATPSPQQQPDLVAAAPPDSVPEAAPVPESIPNLAQVAPPPPMMPMLDPSLAVSSGPDVIANNHENEVIQDDPEEAVQALEDPEINDQRPPDILNVPEERSEAVGSDLQIREPVDGGNEEVLDNLPMHRLVLGQSEPPPPMLNSGERSEAAGSEQFSSRSQTIGSDSVQVQNVVPIVETERIEAVGSTNEDIVMPPVPASIPPPVVAPPPPMNSIPSAPEQRSEAAGADSNYVGGQQIGFQPPPVVPPQQPMVFQPPPVAPPPTTSEERSEAAGSDRKEIPPNPKTNVNLAPPPLSRNVTGSDNKGSSKPRRRVDESDEDESVFSRESEKRSHHSHRNRGHSPSRRGPRGPRGGGRTPSPVSRSSSLSEEESYRSNRDRRDQRDQRREKDRRKDHKRSSHHRSYRDDRSYREDRYYDRNDRSRRSHADSYSSRPSSRQGHNYPNYHHDYSYYYGGYPNTPYAPAAPPTPDTKTLEIFKKNWEYYSRNPQEMENLRVTNPTQHANLFRYYQMFGHLLPSIQPDRPSSRASSVKASSTSFQQVPHFKGEESTILQPSDQTNHYQPTPEASAIHEEPEVAALTEKEVIEEPPMDPQRLTPVKFSTPHVHGIFGPLGKIIKVKAKSPLDGQTATLEMHSLKAIMSRQPGFKELQSFPGPLVPGTTHKGEVIQFCQNKIQTLLKSKDKMGDKDSIILMWDLMILLLRQKNTIDGSDIAELLLRDRDVHRPYVNVNNNVEKKESTSSKGSDVGSGISSDIEQETDEDFVKVTKNNTVLTSAEETQRHTAKFRDYLLFGHKKEGLEYAMSHGLWGHALFLASKMDERSYSQVMLRFANGLAVNDPLQTLYQLMSGRQPIAVKECADANWGDWRPHLAMILSNSGAKNEGLKSIMTLGDTLSERGYLWAGQFCYLMANKEFGNYKNKASKIVLIGADRSLPFEQFASNEAIQITEVFEYVQKLSNPEYVQHSFLYYKYLYAIRLLDHGMTHQALHYLEELAQVIVKDPGNLDEDIKANLGNILFLADKMKYLDPMYTTREGEMSEMGDPQWIIDLRSSVDQIKYGQIQTQEPEPWQGQDDQGRVYYYDAATNSYYYPEEGQPAVAAEDNGQPQVEEVDQHNHEEIHRNNGVAHESSPAKPPLAELPPQQEKEPTPRQSESESRRESESSSVQPPPPMMMVPQSVAPPPPMMAPLPELPKMQKQPSFEASPPMMAKPAQPPPSEPTKQKEQKKPAEKAQKESAGGTGPGLFGRFLGKIGVLPPNQAHLPDDKENTIVWDEDKKRWVDKNAAEDEDNAASSAPPSDMELSRTNSTANFESASNNAPAMPPMMPMGGANKFAGGLSKKRGALGRVDVFKNSQSSPALSSAAAPPPNELFAPPPAAAMPPMAPVEENVAAPAPAATTPDGAPVFFNPTSFAGAAPSTRRNKYS